MLAEHTAPSMASLQCSSHTRLYQINKVIQGSIASRFSHPLSHLPPCPMPIHLQRLVEKEEREKRRAEAAKEKEDARRYPMEDLELLQELREKAAEAGES